MFALIYLDFTKVLMGIGKLIKLSTYQQKKFIKTASNPSSTVTFFIFFFLSML